MIDQLSRMPLWQLGLVLLVLTAAVMMVLTFLFDLLETLISGHGAHRLLKGPHCRLGIHPHVVTGRGMFGDAGTCLHCGTDL